MCKTFFISDLHFHHKNILLYEPSRALEIVKMLEKCTSITLNTADVLNRTEQMLADPEKREALLNFHDNMLITYWNDTVDDDDTVWFLGDLGLGPRNRIEALARQLKGHKNIILGNHDKLSKSAYHEMGFEQVIPYGQQVVLKNYFVLSHEPPQYIPHNSPYFYIYGHVHGSELYPTRSEHSQCVCVERQNFRPVEIDIYNEAE